MSESPRLSVIVPAHRAGATLPRALAALRGGDDPGVPWELIVVDDGSGAAATEETARLARAHAALRCASEAAAVAKAKRERAERLTMVAA